MTLQRYGVGGFHRQPCVPAQKLYELFQSDAQWRTGGLGPNFETTLRFYVPTGVYRLTLENTAYMFGATYHANVQTYPCHANGVKTGSASRRFTCCLYSKAQRLLKRSGYAEIAFECLKSKHVLITCAIRNPNRYRSAYALVRLMGNVNPERIQVVETPAWVSFVRRKLRPVYEEQHVSDHFIEERAFELGDTQQYYQTFFANTASPQSLLHQLKTLPKLNPDVCNQLEVSIRDWQSHWEQESDIPVKLLITDIALRHHWHAFAFLFTWIARMQPKIYQYGSVHTALQVGPWIIDLMGHGFIIPRFAPDPSAVFDLDIAHVKKEELATLLQKVSSVATTWNRTEEYQLSRNCQQFTTHLLKQLGYDHVLPPMIKTYLERLRRLGEKAFFSFVQPNDNDNTIVTFKNHQQLDSYVKEHQITETDARWLLLKAFDRAFWLRHNRHPEQARWQCKSCVSTCQKQQKHHTHAKCSCPFGDPNLSVSGFIS